MADRVGYNPADFEWETAHTEAGDQIQFDKIGDDFVGEYQGSEVIEFTDKDGEPQSFTQLHFRVRDHLYDINAGYELRQAFEKIEPGTVCRVQYIKDVRISGQQSPMKSFRVETAKGRAGNSKG